MTTLYLDLETYSPIPITAGTFKYASEAEVILFAYAVDDEPVQVWQKQYESMPEELINALCKAEIVVIHNSMFDLTILEYDQTLWTRAPSIKRVHDTMIQALAHGLPGGLEQLGAIMGLSQDKKKINLDKRIMRKFCTPAKKGEQPNRDSHPEDWAHFVEYAKQDIVAMREIYKKMPKWNMQLQSERDLWILDQQINFSGVLVDVEYAEAAMEAVKKTQKKLKEVMADLSDGIVTSATQRDVFLAWFEDEYGIALPDLTASTVKQTLSDKTLPEEARIALQTRLDSTTTSTAKYKKLVSAANTDGRLRGTLQFCGAARTGRWAGRVFQPQNLPRPTLSNERIDEGIEITRYGGADLILKDIMEVTSSALRGCIVAPKGKKLLVADLSNIEGRVAAWVAGEKWKVKAFEEFDNGEGEDLYKIAYAKAFNIEPKDVNPGQRFLGKVLELSMGYGGGVGAFNRFVNAYGTDLDSLADQTWVSFTQQEINRAKETYNWAIKEKRTYDLSERAYIMAEILKTKWRQAHPAIVQLWRDLEIAAHDATVYKGNGNQRVGIAEANMFFERRSKWTNIVLPSGRRICYPAMRVGEDGMEYKGVNGFTRKWETIGTYGGKLFENICQSIARDVLAHGMLRIAKDQNTQIVMTVHDEIICEAPDDGHTLSEGSYTCDFLINHLTANPMWALSLPLEADGFECRRYRKD